MSDNQQVKRTNGAPVQFPNMPEGTELNEKLDIENTLELLRNSNGNAAITLIKVKAAINLLMRKKTFRFLLGRCFDKDNGGQKIRTGSFELDDFRITAISSLTDNREKLALIFKYCPAFGYMKDAPGTVQSFSVKRLSINTKTWNNIIELRMKGNYGKEFSVKINFFTYN